MDQRRRVNCTLIAAAVLVATHAFGEPEKRAVYLQVRQSRDDSESLAATAYGLALADWVQIKHVADSAPEGRFIPTFEAELHAYHAQLEIWRELNEKQPRHLKYMDDLVKVEQAGYLGEYLWHYHSQPAWGRPPESLRTTVFLEWQAAAIPGHRPQTDAQIVFGPPKK